MSRSESLFGRFSDRAARHTGAAHSMELYFTGETALELLDCADNEHIAMIGLEGFFPSDDGKIRPSIDVIVDKSPSSHWDRNAEAWEAYVKRTNRDMREVLSRCIEQQAQMLFAVVLCSPDEI